MKIGREGLRRLRGGGRVRGVVVGGGRGQGGVPDVLDVATAKEGHAEEVADKGNGGGDDGRLVAVLLDSLEAVEEEPECGNDAGDDGGRAGPVGAPSSVEEVGDGEAHVERCCGLFACRVSRVSQLHSCCDCGSVWCGGEGHLKV